MNQEVIEKLVLALGGAVGGGVVALLSTKANEYRARGRERRKIAGRLWVILGHIFIEVQVRPALKEAGVLTVYGLFDVDESWRDLLPPEPPVLPKDFDSILEKVAEWEVESGDGEITKKLQFLRDQLGTLNSIYAGLKVQAQKGAEFISERALDYYTKQLPGIQETVTEILHLVSPMRLHKVHRLSRDLSYRIRKRFRSVFQRRKLSPSN
jgi:hypothetical protein